MAQRRAENGKEENSAALQLEGLKVREVGDGLVKLQIIKEFDILYPREYCADRASTGVQCVH